MSKKLFIFEDDKFSNFYPLTYSRPIYELLCGILKLRDKLIRLYPDAEVILLCRDYIAEVVRQRSSHKVNNFNLKKDDQLLFVNGRILAEEKLSQKINFSEKEKAFSWMGELLALNQRSEDFKKFETEVKTLYKKTSIESILKKVKRSEIKLGTVNYIWDFIKLNSEEIIRDFTRLSKTKKDNFRKGVDSSVRVYNPDNVHIGKNCRIDAFVVLDARKGPIYIDENVEIQSFTRIEGPSYIGAGAILLGAKLREGTSISPFCRVGGEIENSIFLGYSNKYHDGFLGHSYIGEWVNLGAMTTNSDLKNNYGRIKVVLNGKEIDTGLIKVGSMIGDHVKTGIGTLLNTGMIIGFGSNVFGGGMVKEKFIPSFSWGGVDGFTEYKLGKMIETAETVMKRRRAKLTSKDKKLFSVLFELTKEERR
ncbi:MAG TPA: putative sugar nucleotidyl transferase [Terriglobales bacterium]|nr:putative sugar nucleotidyl transferase [Terriglobales bacterium]